VIWATDLVEHSTTTSSGKNKPSVTSYSYTSSFAVALASRPILSLGRIWADGNLLRGADGDLKVGGTLRIYTGTGDQAPDPLIASAEGSELPGLSRHRLCRVRGSAACRFRQPYPHAQFRSVLRYRNAQPLGDFRWGGG
jgi:hypothetical protein